MQNVAHVLGQIRNNRITAPVVSRLDDDQRPDWPRRQNRQPRRGHQVLQMYEHDRGVFNYVYVTIYGYALNVIKRRYNLSRRVNLCEGPQNLYHPNIVCTRERGEI